MYRAQIVCDLRFRNPATVVAAIQAQITTRHCVGPRHFITADSLSMDAYGEPGRVTQEALDWLVHFKYLKKRGPGYMGNAAAYDMKTRFVIIYADEFYTIMDSRAKNREALVAHFIRIVKSIDYYDKIGTMSQKYFAEEEEVAEKTIARMNKQLADLGLIYYVGRSKTVDGNTYCTNLYGRPDVKDEIDRRAMVHNKKNPQKLSGNLEADYSRFVAAPTSFSAYEVCALHAKAVAAGANFGGSLDKIKEYMLQL